MLHFLKELVAKISFLHSFDLLFLANLMTKHMKFIDLDDTLYPFGTELAAATHSKV